MLQGMARPIFLTACACNLGLAIVGGFAVENQILHGNSFALIAGPLAFIAAAGVGLSLLLDDYEGMHRGWIKAALVFLALGPLAFWFLQWPAINGTMCLDHCINATAATRALGDVIQAQAAMIAAASAALFCATRATTAPLEELAV